MAPASSSTKDINDSMWEKSEGICQDLQNAFRETMPSPGQSIREYFMSRLILVLVPALLMFFLAAGCAVDPAICGKPSIVPRHAIGLLGIVFAPLIHTSWHSFMIDFWGWLTLAFGLTSYGPKLFTLAVLFLAATSGLFTWVIGNAQEVHVGTAGILFGIFAFNLSILPFKRPLPWTDVACFIVFDVFFGGLWWTAKYSQDNTQKSQKAGVETTDKGYSSTLALSGLLMGVAFGWIYYRYLAQNLGTLNERMPLMHKGLSAADEAVGAAASAGVAATQAAGADAASSLEKGLGDAKAAAQKRWNEAATPSKDAKEGTAA